MDPYSRRDLRTDVWCRNVLLLAIFSRDNRLFFFGYRYQVMDATCAGGMVKIHLHFRTGYPAIDSHVLLFFSFQVSIPDRGFPGFCLPE